MRGILRTFGYVLAKKLRGTHIANVREIIESDATLEPILMPMLRTLAATTAQLQVYDRSIDRFGRTSETACDLMGRRLASARSWRMPRWLASRRQPAFSRSSAVGAYFGMTPRRYQSDEVDQAMRLEMRRWRFRGLLYEAAKVLLSRSARPTIRCSAVERNPNISPTEVMELAVNSLQKPLPPRNHDHLGPRAVA